MTAYLLYGNDSGHVARRLWSAGVRVNIIPGNIGQEHSFVIGPLLGHAGLVTCGIVIVEGKYEVGCVWSPIGDLGWASNGSVAEYGIMCTAKGPGIMEMVSCDGYRWTATDWVWNNNFLRWVSSRAKRSE